MESIGKLLKQAREKSGYNIDQAARETHISRRYLRALENEDFSVFPGETYTIGFLRNYAEYLELNPEEIITLYKNLKIQEQPLPMDELLKAKPKRGGISKILVLVIILGIVGAGGYFLYAHLTNRPPKTGSEEAVLPAKASKNFIFQEEAITRWFNKGDTIQYELGKKNYKISIDKIDDGVTVKTGTVSLNLKLGLSGYIDLDSDSKPDIKIVLNDIDKKASIERVNLGLYKITKPVASAEEKVPAESSAEQTVNAESGSTLILEAPAAEPFTINCNFRGYCMFRYLRDKKEREERFFHKGEQISIDVKNTAVLWVSNAGVLKVTIGGKSVQMGKPGEVVTKQIKWVKNESGDKFLLKMFSVY